MWPCFMDVPFLGCRQVDHGPSTCVLSSTSEHLLGPSHRPSPNKMFRSPLAPLSNGDESSIPFVQTFLTPSRYAHYTGPGYVLQRVLGKGAFGKVWLVRAESSGRLCAMKTIDRFRLNTPHLKKAAAREIKILRHLPAHCCIASLVEVVEVPRSIHIVLEYMEGGTLQQYVAENGHVGEQEAQRISWQLLGAIAHCHDHNICHRSQTLIGPISPGPYVILMLTSPCDHCLAGTSSLKTSCGVPAAAAAAAAAATAAAAAVAAVAAVAAAGAGAASS